ncbi:MAG: glycosyltransferase family 2 protein [Lachnospiraceae bacterium]|nr:glycosyltransferase family 2 protein [Lachnospiraceae bacterium]
MKSTLKVSVCISTWSRKSKLSKIIQRLEQQSFPRDLYEIVVIDSNSPDGTDRMVEEMNNVYGNIVYVKDTVNILAAKRNEGLAHSSGEIIIFIDDDVFPTHRFIEAHYKAYQNSENTFFCGQIRFPARLCRSSNYFRFRDEQHLKKRDEGKDLPYNRIVVMNLSGPRALFEQVGDFDERFIGYGGEDQEFGYRLCKKGYKLRYAGNALAFHLDDTEDIVD